MSERSIALQDDESNVNQARLGHQARAEHPVVPSRSSLRASAAWWRSLQYMGSCLHSLAPPRPPKPVFTKTIPSTLSAHSGGITLHFYLPDGYQSRDGEQEAYPAIVNFHGGGFTLGHATDDARFARFAIETTKAVFISVDYRRAPEHPFPTAVQDGVDAFLYIIRHAVELRIDPFRLATSGFSSGGNIALTAPLLLAAQTGDNLPAHRIVAVATWYPITDYTLSRQERRASAVHPEHTLPSNLTDLFDASYLYPPGLDLANPFLSPSKASDDQLKEGIPPHVLFYTCEWDMLLREGEHLARRLAGEPVSKCVEYKEVSAVVHAWDKQPAMWKPAERSEELYRECCERLREIFRTSNRVE